MDPEEARAEEVAGMAGTEEIWTGPVAEWHGPPAPWRWRSAPAAALLNLTGLGLGYLYLHRRWRAAAAVAVAVVLVVVAFATDAASHALLWQAVTVVVLAAEAVDAWRLARPGPREEVVVVPERAARVRHVAVAAVAVLGVVAAYLGYGAAGRSGYAEARAAQARGDCAAAVRGFDAVTGPFELTLSRDVPTAAALRAECTAFLEAQQAQEQRRHQDAVVAYRAFRTAHPRSVLVPFASEHLQRTYADWASMLRQDRRFSPAIDVYRDLLAEVGPGPGAAQIRADLAATYLERSAAVRAQVAVASGVPPLGAVRSAVDDLQVVAQEFADTPDAGAVPEAMAETYSAATRGLGEQRYCDVLPVLEYFAGLPAGAGDVVGRANADRPRALLECGLGHFRAGRPSEAVDPLDVLTQVYPDDGGAPQARSAVIAARVWVTTGRPVPVPAPLGDDSPGSIRVTYVNDSPYAVTVRVAGPTAHEFVLPACAGCSTYAEGVRPSCRASSPSRTLFLQAGEYVDAVDSVVRFANPPDARVLEPRYLYRTCLYVVSPLGVGPI